MGHTDTLPEGVRSSAAGLKDEGLASRVFSSVSDIATSSLRREKNALPDERSEVRPASDAQMSASKNPRCDDWKTLRNMPLTLETFRLVSKRMSLHSWIGRLITRANVPAFERTLTEMPFYKSTADGESMMVRQKAISRWIYGLLPGTAC